MKKTIRLTERDLARLVKRVISENEQQSGEQRLKKIVGLLGFIESVITDNESTPDDFNLDKIEKYINMIIKSISGYDKFNGID